MFKSPKLHSKTLPLMVSEDNFFPAETLTGDFVNFLLMNIPGALISHHSFFKKRSPLLNLKFNSYGILNLKVEKKLVYCLLGCLSYFFNVLSLLI